MVEFNISTARNYSEVKYKKDALMSSLLVAIVLVITVLIADLTRYIAGKSVILVENPSAFIAFMLVPILFPLYLYMLSILSYSIRVGEQVVKLYAQSKHTNNYFIEKDKNTIIQRLLSLNDNTYGQLNKEQKAVLYFAITYNYCSLQWIFDSETLKEVSKATSFNEFDNILNNSSKVLNIKEKFIKRRVVSHKVA